MPCFVTEWISFNDEEFSSLMYLGFRHNMLAADVSCARGTSTWQVTWPADVVADVSSDVVGPHGAFLGHMARYD